jgi:hypothetical protein
MVSTQALLVAYVDLLRAQLSGGQLSDKQVPTTRIYTLTLTHVLPLTGCRNVERRSFGQYGPLGAFDGGS